MSVSPEDLFCYSNEFKYIPIYSVTALSLPFISSCVSLFPPPLSTGKHAHILVGGVSTYIAFVVKSDQAQKKPKNNTTTGVFL